VKVFAVCLLIALPLVYVGTGFKLPVVATIGVVVFAATWLYNLWARYSERG
jgi:hypothetical protein